jgi:acid phosphatase family membrane protein YuiD
MCFKSDSWMKFLHYYKTKFDNENIKLKIGHNKTAVIIEPRLDILVELVIKNFMYFYIKIGI